MAKKVVKTKRKTAAVRKRQPRSYHHGDLKHALIQGVLELVKEHGVDKVSMREAARQAGVSPGAPFRHFASRDELLEAVGFEAQRTLDEAIDAVGGDTPLERIRGTLTAYVHWGRGNPELFDLFSSKKFLPVRESSGRLSGEHGQTRTKYLNHFAEAFRTGTLRVSEDEVAACALGLRALAYGFTRMTVDGHFPRFGVQPDDEMPLIEAALTMFMNAMVSPNENGDVRGNPGSALESKRRARASAEREPSTPD